MVAPGSIVLGVAARWYMLKLVVTLSLGQYAWLRTAAKEYDVSGNVAGIIAIPSPSEALFVNIELLTRENAIKETSVGYVIVTQEEPI